jgi:hypothetical protein
LVYDKADDMPDQKQDTERRNEKIRTAIVFVHLLKETYQCNIHIVLYTRKRSPVI